MKFRGKKQIPWLGSKFSGPRKTVGPTDHHRSLQINYYQWKIPEFAYVSDHRSVYGTANHYKLL